MKRAAMAIGYGPKAAPGAASTLMTFPDVAKAVEEGLSEAARLAGVSRSWVIIRLREIVERCMTVIQVYDKNGDVHDELVDPAGATKALELIGKHLRVFGDDASAQAQVGAAVIRLLAQEAQEGRFSAKSVVTVDTQADRVPSTDHPGDPLASTRAEAIHAKSDMVSPPLSIDFETPPTP